MATEKLGILVSRLADEDLSEYQFHVVVRTATGVRLPNAATDLPYGILQNAPKINEEAVIAPIGCGGFSKAVGGATFPAVGELCGMEYVAADDAGKVNKVVSGQFPFGICDEAAGAEDDLFTVLLAPIHLAITEDLPA